MTYKELIDIRGRLGEWCNARHITLQEQQSIYVLNILEKLTEYARAKTIFDQVDALCNARILQDSIRFYKSTKDKRKDKTKEKYAWDSLLYINILY